MYKRQLILRTAFNRRVFTYRDNLRKIAGLNRRYPAGEVIIWEIEAGEKRILHLGSLNLAPEEVYPRGEMCIRDRMMFLGTYLFRQTASA